jgi:hypothetical protein
MSQDWAGGWGDFEKLGFSEVLSSPQQLCASSKQVRLGLFLPFISGKGCRRGVPFSVCFDSVVFLKTGRKALTTFSVL